MTSTAAPPADARAAAIQAIREIGAATIEHYATDLDHDADAITNAPAGTEFLWYVGKSGTHMAMLRPATDPTWPAKGERVRYLFDSATRETIADGPVITAEHCARSTDYQAFHWTGSKLRSIDHEKAVTIARAWRDALRVAWDRIAAAPPAGYYIVARSGTQRAELVGPFRELADAKSELERVSEEMHARYPEQSAAAAFSVEHGEPSPHGRRLGTKTRMLGYRCCLHGWVCLS